MFGNKDGVSGLTVYHACFRVPQNPNRTRIGRRWKGEKGKNSYRYGPYPLEGELLTAVASAFYFGFNPRNVGQTRSLPACADVEWAQREKIVYDYENNVCNKTQKVI